MKADGFKFDVDVLARDRADLALLAGAQQLFWASTIGSGRPASPGKDDRAAVVVVAICIELAHDRLSRIKRCPVRRRTAHAEDKGVGRDGAHILDEDLRQIRIDRHLHVERSMRLDMLHRHAVAAGELAQSPHLIDDVVDELLAAADNLAATEALQVVIAGMGADPDAMGGGKCCTVSLMRFGSPAWKPVAILAELMWRSAAILRIADPPAAEGFSHIAVDVDDALQTVYPLLSFGKTLRDKTGFEKFNF